MKNSKIKKRMLELIHKWFGIVISLIIVIIAYYTNDRITNINILSSNKYEEVLKSTITFTSIILGLYGGLIGQVISAKNSNNEFIVWYFKEVNKSTFVFNILCSVITAMVLVGISVLLLAVDIFSDEIKFVLTCLWAFNLTSFIIYQTSNYYLFIKMLLVDNPVKKANKSDKANDKHKTETFENSSKAQSFENKEAISINKLLEKK